MSKKNWALVVMVLIVALMTTSFVLSHWIAILMGIIGIVCIGVVIGCKKILDKIKD